MNCNECRTGRRATELESMLTGPRIATVLAAGLLVIAATGSGRCDPVPVVFAEASAAEIEFWRSVEGTSEPKELEAYLAAYPNGQFAALARLRLQKLKGLALQGAAASRPETAAPPAPAATSQMKDIPPAPPHKVRRWIGLRVRPIDDKRAGELGLVAASGAEIERVTKGSPAERGGFKIHDVVLAVDDVPVTDPLQFRQLILTRPGTELKIMVLRDGQRISLGVPVGDYFEFSWASAHRGEPDGMLNLGVIYSSNNYVTKDLRLSEEWLRKAAGAGEADAMRVLGERYYFGKGVPVNDIAAFEWARKAAHHGSPQGQFLLALMHGKGRGTAKNDAEAVRWYQKSADQGLPAAMVNLGLQYQYGQGVEKNLEVAANWYERAVEGKLVYAMSYLGFMYRFGLGRPKNIPEALRLFRSAADKGSGTGLRYLAMMYKDGVGVAKDRDEAIRLLRRSLDTGDQQSLAVLQQMGASTFDPKEIQQLLSDLGFDPGAIDGRPGHQTKQAIREFQNKRGLSVNGEASLSLVGQLREAVKQRKSAATAKKPDAPGAAAQAASGSDIRDLRDLEKLDSFD
ncbi:MAG: peptidoglycan-binding protein [Pseudomonadota bacterium]